MKKYLIILFFVLSSSIHLFAQPAIVEIITTNVTCNGGNDGTVLVRITGGLAPYTYTIFRGSIFVSNPAVLDTFYTFNSVPANSWHVTVEDANGDGITIFNGAIVNQPAIASIASEIITPITCSGFNDGVLQIVGTGGSGNYSYELNPGSITSAIGIYSPLSPGTYNITLSDVTCLTSVVSNNLILANPSVLSFSSESVSDVSCNGGSDGYVHVTATGGTGVYTYTLNPGAIGVNSTGNFNALPIGIYTVDVTDVNTCPIATSNLLEVSEPPLLIISSENYTDITCNGAADGSVTVTAAGGTAPYSYTLNPGGITNATGFFPGLSPGTYSVSLTDSKLCGPVISSNFNIVEPAVISITSTNSTDILCNNDNDGTITITAAGGNAPLTYTLNPGAIKVQPTGNFTGLAAGTYFVNVSDPLGCPEAISGAITIANPPAVSITSEAETDITCNGDNDGIVSVTATGGTGSLHYTLNPASLTQINNGVFTGLSPNLYSVSVTDDNACPADLSSNFNITEPAALIFATENYTDITCNGAADGSVTVTAAGGTAPYSYTLNPGGITNATGFFPGLSSGTYSVSLTDSKLCGPVISSNFNIVEPAVISISSSNSTDILCNNDNDGTITITASGGNAPLTYTLNPGAIKVQPTGNFTGLAAGIYFVNVSDPLGCPEAISAAITIANPPAVSITAEAETDITCNGDNDGIVSVTATGGTGSLHYTLNPASLTQINNGVFTGLSPNLYSVSVTDDNACPADLSSNFNITEPAALTLPIITSTDISCFGNNDGSINVSSAGGTGPYLYEIIPGGISNTTGAFPDLGPGTYSISVTDANLCSNVFTNVATIIEPPVLGISLAKTDILCNGFSNGTITVTATGGSLPYQYSKNGIVYQLSNEFLGLTQNNYTIWVKDANGCLISDIIAITEPAELKINSEINSSINNICYGDSFGEIRILSVSGGVEPYNYSIDNGINYVTTSDFQFLPAGSYQVKVKDDNNCVATGSLLLISQPPVLKVTSLNHLDVSGCFGDVNGQVAIEGTGGTGTKYYEIDGGSRNTTGIFNPVSGGLHSLSIIDDNNCRKDTFETILEPAEITFTSINLTDVSGCAGDNNGIIDASAIGGTGLLQYELDLTGLQASGYFDLQFAGNYKVYVEDASGCRIDSSISITEPDPISIDSESVLDASCAGLSDGEVSITVSGGTSPYSYTLNPGSISNITGVFSSLPKGDYTISVDDLNTCGPVTSNVLTVSEPPAIILDSITTSEVLCAGENTAEIHIYLSGGSGPFQYSIDDGVNFLPSSDFTSINAGTYYISAKDANLCTLEIDTISFIDPAALTKVTENVTGGAVCFGDAVGLLEYEVSGGTGSIEYSVDNGVSWQSSGNYSSMPGGDYIILARDQNNCELNSSVLTIIEPTEITADISVTPALDEFNLGSINITNATGGAGGLEFSISGLGGPFSSQTDYPDLIAGIYEVYVRDLNLCTIDTTVEVEQIPALSVTVSITHLSCNNTNDGTILMLATDPQGFVQYSIDDSASWSDAGLFEDLLGGDYIIFARDSVGRFFGDTITVIEPIAVDIFSNITPATCTNLSSDGEIDITVIGASGTVSYSWSTGAISQDISGLNAGKYWIDVIDANLCSATDTIEVPGITNVTANAGADTSLCFGQSIILNGQGGTLMSWLPETGLSNPNISNPVVQSDTSITYYLTVVGLNDCYDIDTISITVYPNLGLNAGNDTSIITGQSAIIPTSGGPYLSYLWEPATGVDDTESASPVITPLATTNYIVSGLTEDGCFDKDTITISLIENLIVYNAFSPNEDGRNDFWDIENAEFFPDIIVEVYNRWGEKLFSSAGYTDDKRWDGKSKGKEAPVGTYYFVVIPYSGATPITGPLTIVR